MIKPFKGDFRLTQGFGENPASYARFGIKGHNGLDYGTPTGTPILAPFSGKVIETASDPTGYGNYIKIENTMQGSVLAHLQSFKVKVGDNVSEGQAIATSDNTGNSTGAHLHWGYYTLPRNRQNGYAGFIDQLPMLGGVNMANMYKGLDLNNPDSMKVAVDIWDQVVNQKLYLKKDEAVTKTEYEALNRQLVECRNRPIGDPEATKTLSEAKTTFKKLHGLLGI